MAGLKNSPQNALPPSSFLSLARGRLDWLRGKKKSSGGRSSDTNSIIYGSMQLSAKEEGGREGGSLSLPLYVLSNTLLQLRLQPASLFVCVLGGKEGREAPHGEERKELPLQEVAIANYLVAVNAMHAVKLHKNLHFLPRRVRAMKIGRGGMASVGPGPTGRHADDNQLDLQGDPREALKPAVSDARRRERDGRPVAEHDLLARYISRIRKEEGEGRREGKDV